MLKFTAFVVLALFAAPAVAADHWSWLAAAPAPVIKRTVKKASASCPCGRDCECGPNCGCPQDGTCLCDEANVPDNDEPAPDLPDEDKELRDLRAYRVKMEAWLTEQGYRNPQVSWSAASRPVARQAVVTGQARSRTVQPVVTYYDDEPAMDCSSGQCVPRSNAYIGNGWLSGFKSFRSQGTCVNCR